MCQDCGCGLPEEKTIEVNASVTAVNDQIAHQIWHHLKEKELLCVNIMGSPGSGKTSFIEGLSKHIGPEKLFVIQGDLESDIDKDRLEKIGIDSYQINTHSGCHLNASMINKALLDCDLKDKSYLLIENVGNLVCPAGVKLGQHMDIVISSTAEGSDKPLKYPHIFKAAQLVVITKYDLKDAVEFDEESFTKDLSSVNHHLKVFKTTKNNPHSFHAVAHMIEHTRDHFFEREHRH